MYILYKNSTNKNNIIGYFYSRDVITDSLKITYSGIKNMALREHCSSIEVLSIVGKQKNVIDKFYVEPLFICDKADHL